MADDTDERLHPGMLLKCSRCGSWHEVKSNEADVGTTTAARDMLYWTCRGDRFFAGNLGGTARYATRRRSDISARRDA
jgi:hypothetical protein